MKRLLCILLCLVFSLGALVGCAEEPIGEDLDKLPPADKGAEEITLNFYIVCGDDTTQSAMNTVEQYLSQYSKDKFNTLLKMHYVTEAEYEATVMAKTAVNAEDRADIVLINSADMLDKLVKADLVAELTSYYHTNRFGTLKVQITPSILEAAKIRFKTDPKKDFVDGLFCVPNNHVVGEYKFLLVDKDNARSFYYSDADVAAMDTYEKTQGLRDKMLADNPDAEISKYIKIESGSYDTVQAYKNSDKWHCTIIENPTVTKLEALSSAFSIVKGTKSVERCMEIIYALNNDVEFRNLLQYGVKDTMYTLDKNNHVTLLRTDASQVYNMNLKYTGDVFTAYACNEIGWSDAVIASGRKQNADSVAAK